MKERAVRVECGPDGRPLGRDPELASLMSAYQDAVVRSSLLDPVITELVRLRCARQHDCRICQTLRLADAADLGLDADMAAKVDLYEQKWSTQKIHVVLGTDGPDRLPIGSDGVSYFRFDESGRATGFSAT